MQAQHKQALQSKSVATTAQREACGAPGSKLAANLFLLAATCCSRTKCVLCRKHVSSALCDCQLTKGTDCDFLWTRPVSCTAPLCAGRGTHLEDAAVCDVVVPGLHQIKLPGHRQGLLQDAARKHRGPSQKDEAPAPLSCTGSTLNPCQRLLCNAT